MPMANRAAQFVPFSALSGHGDAIDETARLTDDRIQLSEDEQRQLSQRLLHALSLKDSVPPPVYTFTYFIPDERKDGGRYAMISGSIKKVDETERLLHLSDGTTLPLDCIISISDRCQNGNP